ncbi:LamG domain-containing protein [Streptomyces vietnamensis]|nr:LamG domain-containing protein [Streptomyces vietnamensis]
MWAEDPEPAAGGSMLSAQQEAMATGQEVPVDALTTETTEIVANADGSFTSTTSLMPVRVRKDGAWVPVDATLRQNEDGTWSPKATPHGVALSGGGTGPVVRLSHEDGTKLALATPFPLPAPTVSGDTAFYREVLPGIDLSVSVTDQGGFSDVLIVHDAAAASDPRVKELRLGVSAEGLAIAPTESGGMEARTADGSLDYISPRPIMWDSATLSESAISSVTAKTAANQTDSISVQALETDGDTPVTPPVAVSSVEGPGVGAVVDSVPMTTSSSAVTLRPDPDVLAGPDTVYPVFIDPYTNPISKTSGNYTEVYSSSQCANSPQYNKPQSNGEGVGYQRWGGACGIGLERSYYAINTTGFAPEMVISKAIMSVPSTYAASWDCSKDQPITLHTTGAINEATDWNSKPTAQDATYAAVRTTIPSAANPSSSCSNHTASFTVTAQAQKIADSGLDWWTVGLYGDETQSSTNDNYLRLSTVITLITTFDMPPKPPTSLYTTPSATGASGPCVTSGVGWIGATTYSAAGSNLRLHSTVTTNIAGELASANYLVWDRTLLTDGNPDTVASSSTTYVASGTSTNVLVGATLKDGHEYGWNVYAETNSSAHLRSPVTSSCWFRTDFSPPKTPDIAVNPSFPPVGSGVGNPLVYAGSPPTDFSVSADDKAPADTCAPGACLSSGIDHFIWRLDSQPTALVGTSVPISSTDTTGTSTAKVKVPVTAWGVHTLYVAAVDNAGNLSQAPGSYTYTVPWDPNTKITPGDIGGDGIPDLLATTRTGDLVLLPGNTDSAQPVAPAQTAPLTTPASGPVTVSTPAQSPDKTGWNNYLIAHRGNLHGSHVDDLFAYNKQSHQLYVVRNDLDPNASTPYYSTGFMGDNRSTIVVKEICEQDVRRVKDDALCRTAGYNESSWDIEQLVTPGNVFGNENNYPAVITVEGKKLWIYQADGGNHLKNPLLLGDGDWSGYTLIAPGTVGGTLTKSVDEKGNVTGSVTGGSPVLWARDDISGSVLTFPISIDPVTLLPTPLHAPVRTAFTSAVAASGGGKLCLDVYNGGTADGTKVQAWGCNQTRAQTWSLMSDGTIRAMGGCLDVYSAGKDNGTPVQLHSCNGTPAQEWVPYDSGSLRNPNSSKCLDDPNASTAAGTQLQIYTCNGTAAQNWTTGAAAGWDKHPAAPLAPVLPTAKYPAVMSPGDINGNSGGPDGHPELYAVDSAGQLMEYPGAAPKDTVAAFSAPASLGAVGNTATHNWRLNEGTGSSATDDPGDLNAALTGAYTWTTDATRGKVLQLSGTTGYAATTKPAVNTTGSFTVSAWVKLGSLSGNSSFVSQSDGAGGANGFQLYYSSGAKVWAFGRHNDGTSGPSFSAAYGASAVVGKWTHLVGVYDVTTDQLLLYVDGKLSATKAYTGISWNADGGVQIGRRVYESTYGEYANGAVSDVRIYPTALPAASAAATGQLPGIMQLD